MDSKHVNKKSMILNQPMPQVLKGLAKMGKMSAYHDDFMDLNESFTRSAAVEGPTEDSFKSDETDHPKSNVDLLASLLTLGKMIQD